MSASSYGLRDKEGQNLADCCKMEEWQELRTARSCGQQRVGAGQGPGIFNGKLRDKRVVQEHQL